FKHNGAAWTKLRPCMTRICSEIETMPRTLRQEALYVRTYSRGDVLREGERRHRSSFMRAQDLLRVPFEHFLPREEAIHDAPESVKVRWRPNMRSCFAYLLGGDPAHRART